MATKEQKIRLYNKLSEFLYEIDNNIAANDHWRSLKQEFVKAGYKFLNTIGDSI